MVGEVVDGRVILHESQVFQKEDSYFDLYEFSIVITLPEVVDGEHVSPSTYKDKYWNLPANLKYMTHHRVFDAEGSHFVDESIHSSFWEAQTDYKRRYFRVAEPTSSTQDTQPLPSEKESTFISRWRRTLIGAIIGVAILFYFLRFAGYF
tara:strand:- start:125 stop:574 length:450 start_codon:yes stop_codon:yes gene_type:complete